MEAHGKVKDFTSISRVKIKNQESVLTSAECMWVELEQTICQHWPTAYEAHEGVRVWDECVLSKRDDGIQDDQD